MSSPSDSSNLSSLASLLSVLLNSDFIRLLITEIVQWWNTSRFHGTYRVEAHHVTLDLTDAGGRLVKYTKRQRVTFLQNNVFAIQDQAWGDGNIFAHYMCSPGAAVDRYKEGYRWKILISLRGTRNIGDTESMFVERTITDGFTTPVGNFQTQVDHLTQDLTIKVLFPAGRHPKQVTLIEQNAKRTHRPDKENITVLPQGRIQYQWQIRKPHLYESYIVRWEW
ncbi:MAG: hypothetical protein LCI00_24405 [Chloroflexi bacterium]|nr:hypothetical protein [Chloroflexota bacterium]